MRDAVALAIQTSFLDKKVLLPDFTQGRRNAGRYLMPGTLVVLGSTITAGMAGEILEAESGRIAGEDFALAHAPGRVMVGRLLRNIWEHDRVVGGIDQVGTVRAVELYSPVHSDDCGQGDEDRREHFPRPPDRGGEPARPLL